LIKIRSTEILVRLLPRQQDIHNGSDRMADRNQRAVLPASCGNPCVLGRERRSVRVRGHLGNCDEPLPWPTMPFARLPAQALAPTLVVPRAHPRPGSEVLSTRETAHIGLNFREEDFRCPWTNARNRLQQSDGLLLRRQPLANCPTDALNGFVQVLERILSQVCI
jgi:hypothetical protein